MHKFFKLFGALVAMLAQPLDERDADKFAETLKQCNEFIKSADAQSLEGVAEMKAKIEKLQTDVEKEIERRIALEKMHLASTSFSRPVVMRDQETGRLRFQFSTPQKAKGFARFCQAVYRRHLGQGVDEEFKALNPVSDAEGAYTIPDEWTGEIEIMIEAVGKARLVAGPIPLPAGTWKKARRLSGAIMHWKAPGATVADSTPTFGQIEMSAETLMGLIDTDLEFEEDTMLNVGNYLATEFAYAVAGEEDRVAFVGTGVGTDGGITGVLNSTYVTIVDMDATKTAFTDMTYDNLVDMEAAVWEGALDNASWLWHRTIKALAKKLKDTANMPIWQPTVGNEPGELMGYPHVASGKMRATAASAISTTFLAFGDFRRGLLIGRRGQLRIDYSNIPGWRTAQGCWRALERIDMAVQGFTAAEIAAHPELANPIAVLKTAGA